MSDLVKRLRMDIEPSEGDMEAAADLIETQAARIAELEAALQDMSKHVWRGDWDKLKPETRALLDQKK